MLATNKMEGNEAMSIVPIGDLPEDDLARRTRQVRDLMGSKVEELLAIKTASNAAQAARMREALGLPEPAEHVEAVELEAPAGMRPHAAQGSSHNGGLVSAPPPTSLDAIRDSLDLLTPAGQARQQAIRQARA